MWLQNRMDTTIESIKRDLESYKFNFIQFIENSVDGVLIIDAITGEVLYANRMSSQLFNKSIGNLVVEILGLPLAVDKQIELNLNSKNGPITVSMKMQSTVWNNADSFFATVRDVSGYKLLLNKLNQQSTTDALCDCFNRRGFMTYYTNQYEDTKFHDSKLALAGLDLDGFKQVNDVYGHDAGDEVLRVVAKRLKDINKNFGTLGRLGGDEFSILFNQFIQDSEVLLICEKIIKAISEPIKYKNKDLNIGVSIGVAFYGGLESQEDLIKMADSAMYHSKKSGKGIVTSFHKGLDVEFDKRQFIIDRLDAIISQDMIYIKFKKVYDISLTTLVAVFVDAGIEFNGNMIFLDSIVKVFDEFNKHQELVNYVATKLNFLLSQVDRSVCLALHTNMYLSSDMSFFASLQNCHGMRYRISHKTPEFDLMSASGYQNILEGLFGDNISINDIINSSVNIYHAKLADIKNFSQNSSNILPVFKLLHDLGKKIIVEDVVKPELKMHHF